MKVCVPGGVEDVTAAGENGQGVGGEWEED